MAKLSILASHGSVGVTLNFQGLGCGVYILGLKVTYSVRSGASVANCAPS